MLPRAVAAIGEAGRYSNSRTDAGTGIEAVGKAYEQNLGSL